MTQWIVSSSILILIVIGLRFLLRKRIKPILQYALWALVLVRLLVPLQLGSTPISLENAVEKAPVVQQMELADRVVHFVYHADGTATGYYEYQPPLDHTAQTPVSKPVPQTFTQQEAQSITRIRDVKGLLQKVWLGGMAVFGLVFLLSNLRFALRLRKSRKLEKEGRLPVYITDKVETPCLFGLLQPAIYLPPAVAEEPRHRDYSVAHETTHFRHGDALWAVLRCVCIVLHWYNPLVWWAAVLSREDGEIACDEATITALGEELRGDYGRVLVDLTCRKRTDLLQTATTMTGSAKGLKQRISMIVKRPKMAIYALICLILVASIAIGCTFTGGKKPAKQTGDDPVETTESTESTKPSENTESTKPTQNTTKPNATEKLPDTIPGTPLTEEELNSFTQLFTETPTNRINWYHQLLCVGRFLGFYSPQSVDPVWLFYNGFTSLDQEAFGINAQDQAFLDSQKDYVPQADSFKLPVAEMDKITQAYLGIPLKATNQSTLARQLYNPENNCYYTQHTDYQSMENVQAIDGKRSDDGTVHLLFAQQYQRTIECLLLLQLTPNPGNETIPYRVYSAMQLPRETLNLITPAASPEAYGKIKDGFFPFIYTGRPLMTDIYRIDPTGLEVGKLYLCDARTGNIHLIANEKVSCFDATSQHLYYVTADGKQVIRCDYEFWVGNRTIVYTSTGTITSIDHYGTYANDQLLLVEDHSKVVLYQLSSGERKELFTRPMIFDAHYDSAKRFFKEKSGPAVMWRGLPKEDSETDSWLYFVSSGEETWLDRPDDLTAGYQGFTLRFSTGIFNGSDIGDFVPMPEDLSDFRKDFLYSYDRLTGIFYQLSDSPVIRHSNTLIQDYLFFTDGKQIFRCNFVGGEMQVIYTSNHQITYLDYRRENDLLITEDRKTVILYQLDTGKAEVVMEQYDIEDAFYYPDSSELDGRQKGRAVFWHGKTPRDTQINQYVYYIDLNELYNPPWL